MHVKKAHPVALGGILTAFSVISMVLAGVFPYNTLFFLIIAAIFTAFSYYYSNLRFGLAAMAASAVLGFFLAPQKGIIITYLGLSLYLILAQVIEKHFYDRGMAIYWGLKCLVFNVIFWMAFALVDHFAGATGILSQRALEFIGEVTHRWILIPAGIVLVELGFLVTDRVYFLVRNRLTPLLER